MELNAKKIAEKIRKLRRGEQKQRGLIKLKPGETENFFYNDSKGEFEYFLLLKGYQNFLAYVTTLGSNTVLDAGAGDTTAISNIAKFSERDPLLRKLTFKATSLTRNPKIGENLGFKNVAITSFEKMRGIVPNSIGGIVSIFGISYSTEPSLVVENFDKVLVSGGVIKSVFPIEHKTKDEHGNDLIESGREGLPADEFIKYWQEKGYQVARLDVKENKTSVVVAVKPGLKNQSENIAELILNSDKEIYSKTMDKIVSMVAKQFV